MRLFRGLAPPSILYSAPRRQFYRSRVTGEILTGTLNDGVAGLAEVKRRGGVALVQDPDTAQFPSIRRNALGYVDADFVLPLEDKAAVISKLAVTERAAVEKQEPNRKILNGPDLPGMPRPLVGTETGATSEFRCRVHVYSPLAMQQERD